MMIVSSGLGVGLFTYGVAEPILHYEPCGDNPSAGVGSTCNGNRYAHLEDDERAQWAMFLSYFHWGFHGWAAYVVVALLVSVTSHRMCVPGSACRHVVGMLMRLVQNWWCTDQASLR
jgi:choline-glycine betaine transporter